MGVFRSFWYWIQTWFGIYNVKAYGAKGDSSDATQAFINAIAAAPDGSTIAVPSGNYLISGVVNNLNKRLTFVGQLGTRIFATTNLTSMFYVEAKTVFKNIELDGTGVAQVGVKQYNNLPEFYDCITHDFTQYGILLTSAKQNADSSWSNASVGTFKAVRVEGYNCYIVIDGQGLQGTNGSSALLEDCKLYGSVSGQSQLFAYNLVGWHKVEIKGGEFTGVSNTETNCYQCDIVILDGGYYHDMLRGPTVGAQTTNYTIVNNIVRNVGTYGVSADTLEESGVSSTDYGLVANNNIKDCDIGIRTTGSNVAVFNNRIENATNTADAQNAMYFLGGNTPPAWKATTAETANSSYVVPTTANGHVYMCLVSGTTGATEPVWPTTSGGSVVDGTVTWKEYGTDTASGATNVTVGGNHVITNSANGRLFTADNAKVTIVSPNYINSTVYNDVITANGGSINTGKYQYINTTNSNIQASADIVVLDASAGFIAVNLPTQANLTNVGKRWLLVKDSSANLVNVTTTDGSIIGDNTSVQLTRPNQCMEIVMGSGKYHVVHSDHHLYGTAAPTAGTWNVGDRVYNSNPTVLGTAGSQYVIDHWKCTVAGTPGTWVEQHMPTGT